MHRFASFSHRVVRAVACCGIAVCIGACGGAASPGGQGDVSSSASLDAGDGQEVRDGGAEVGSLPRSPDESGGSRSVSETYGELASRGLGAVELSASFDMSGEYIDNIALDRESSATYPSYHGVYVSESGIVWLVYVNDGHVCAVPVGSDAFQMTTETIFVEEDFVVQYDGLRNEFSNFGIDEIGDDGGIGVRVDRIDAQTLSGYGESELKALLD